MKNVFYGWFNLFDGQEDHKIVLEDVKNNISFKGANLWILACAIIVASIGLNVNSTAVVIGAMLISPLMGPILASGFALGTYDFELLKRAMRNLAVATVTSLIASALYFYISPFKEAQSELLSRTSPNIYDVMIAFFGGLVGVIAITRVEKGNPIPGVAIATALMPPLCTAGYGLSTGNLRFFLGAMFLYTINCVFIGFATFTVVKYLKFRPKVQVDEVQEKRVRYAITGIIILIMVPSIYFAFDLYKQQQFNQKANSFIEHEFFGNTIIYRKSTYRTSPKTIELACFSQRFSDSEIEVFNQKLKDYGLEGTKLTVMQDQNLETLKKDILNQVEKSESFINEKDLIIQNLQSKIDDMTFDNKALLKEVSALYPDITSLSISKNNFVFSSDSMKKEIIVLYQAIQELTDEDIAKLTNWFSIRLGNQKLSIYKIKE